MYRNKRTNDPISAPCSIELKDVPRWHPMSYYIKGGVDVDGDSLNFDADTTFDSDEDLASVSVDGSSDARTSVFDIVEQSGIRAYEDMIKAEQEKQSKVTE